MAKKRDKRANQQAKRRAKQRTKPKFRSKVETELVDNLLHRFVTLIKHGLELMLRAPSELAQKEFRKNPESRNDSALS